MCASKKHVCDFPGCDAAFSRSGNLTVHKRTHTGEKPYVCDFPGCNEAFTQSGHLTTHKRTHTGEKPYVCDFPGCGAAFTTSGNLTIHKRTHTGEKPYVCDFPGCNEAFTTSGSLATHKRTHTGEKPHVCDFPGCDAAFTTSGHLARHFNAMHTREGQQRQKRQEERVAKILRGLGFDFKREHVIDFWCVGDVDGKCAKVDFLLLINGHIVFLEVDENQHKFGYGGISCDMKRMAKIVESLTVGGNTLPVIFIRYNPHVFSVDGVRQKVLKKDREAALVAMLQDDSAPMFHTGRPLAVSYMYYDMVEGMPEVVTSAEYNESIRECVVV